ncbi:cysteinyl-tRNA synthetase [Dimargaris verticillata]|uniref:cysteine--tRNA ligase n=1 Tax=Dimargaris verticillata TaxID=2761393 RepID=A0A9W8E8I7_9FUNG|nr:cysteinyl-tRNA synthetase [Dimargaris verticillata]
MSRQQPKWIVPGSSDSDNGARPRLQVYNSLTRSKVDFEPQSASNLVKWYNCGPTVYDASHMGHARVYVTVDIMRRVLRDYFNYDVFLVMNITDIDDKIILRARQNYLVQQWMATDHSQLTEKTVQEVEDALVAFIATNLLPTATQLTDWTDAAKAQLTATAASTMATATPSKLPMHLKTVDAAQQALLAARQALATGRVDHTQVQGLAEQSRDVLAPWLDALRGDQVKDPKVFRDLAAHWEGEYFKDMDALNVERPDMVTRVSEYVPEIVAYIQRIIDNGFAYEAEGSVYFDTRAFDSHPDHFYAKLEPWSAGDTKLLEEGEGSLGSKLTGKKSPSDFALWKRSKPGEPVWNSPWGQGRPGWHIECSVMASEVLGSQLDIHSGGIDLAFPHHDNELAQAEAYHRCPQWVNYFWHPGHLHIEGAKMSKSLKNFITIQEALQDYTARQIRFNFLQQQWDSPMDFKRSTMEEACSLDKLFTNFFMNAKALVQEAQAHPAAFTGAHQCQASEQALIQELFAKQDAVHRALCDSFNTPAALQAMVDLVGKTNVYLKDTPVVARNVVLVERIAGYLTRMFKVFGLADNGPAIGYGSSMAGSGEVDGSSREDVIMPYARVLSKFRDGVRELARAGMEPSQILRLCDQLRDVDLAPLGVLLDDQEDGKALVKLVDPTELARMNMLKQKRLEEKQAQKAAAKAAQEQKRQERLLKGKLAPADMFKTAEHAALYSRYDDDGIPLCDDKGQELPNSRRKKLKKLWDAQMKLHKEYLAAQQA